MQVRPPYLFGGDGRGGGALRFTGDVDTAVVEMAVHGPWSRRLGTDVSTGVRKCLAEHPAAVVIDLRHMADAEGASVAMWLAARRAATALQPPVRLVLCLPPEAVVARRLRRMGAERYLSMVATMGEARESVASRSAPTDLLQISLPPEPGSASMARSLLGHACHAWGLPHLLHPGRLVLSELVANAIEHAATDMLVTVSRRGTGLHMSVRDGDPRMPMLLHPVPVSPGDRWDERGQGLRLVHAAAAGWGAMPTRGGKVVWATVRHPNGAPR